MINNNFIVKYSKQFQIELQDSVRWYNLQKKGLGTELREEVKNIVSDIILNPTFASIKYDDVRVVGIDIFPYTIHYKIYDTIQKIRILSLFHTKRKPNWL
jgi:toxin ParE1/3/4